MCWGGEDFVQKGVLCVGLRFGWFGRVCAGLAPRAPCFCSVGGGAPVGGIVCAEDAGLCVVQKRGLSPLTPVVTSQGCLPVLRGVVEVCHLCEAGFL